MSNISSVLLKPYNKSKIFRGHSQCLVLNPEYDAWSTFSLSMMIWKSVKPWPAWSGVRGWRATAPRTSARPWIWPVENPTTLSFWTCRLPDGNGLDMLPRFNSLQDPPEVIILTGKGDPDGAELAMQQGVWDLPAQALLVKEISLSLKRALSYRKQKRGARLRGLHQARQRGGGEPGLPRPVRKGGHGLPLRGQRAHHGRDRQPQGVVRQAHPMKTAAEPRRASWWWIAPPSHRDWWRSTLFGHRKGAFTSAHNDQPGLVKLADKGTLFLDEAGEMPLSLQKSFLRVLQERRYRPVGETREGHEQLPAHLRHQQGPRGHGPDRGLPRRTFCSGSRPSTSGCPLCGERGEDITHLTTH